MAMGLVDGCLEKTLDVWATSRAREFPPNENMAVRYKGIKQGLSEYLNNTNLGATVSDGTVLTDHGPGHIAKVIERASKLVERADLKPLEVYMLLVAIQLHDLGNYYGRKGHENKISDIIQEKHALFGTDQFEIKTIQSIAIVHSGTIPGTSNKDTISSIQEHHWYTESDRSVRPRLLAAILRFADELADDKSRANVQMLRDNQLPRECEIYHAYAASLHNVQIINETREIRLHFTINSIWLCKKFGKGESEVYLIDEILERVFKMHLERRYCMCFCRPEVDFDKIHCEIGIFKDISNPDEHRPSEEIKFQLVDSGYPSEPTDGIYSICPNLCKHDDNGKLTGSLLAKKYSDSSF